LDQLSRARSEGLAFQGLTEGAISFPPTYKYDKVAPAGGDENLDVFDTSPKQRVPSWTDRVLYKPTPSPVSATEQQRQPDGCSGDCGGSSSRVVLLSYASVAALRSSDHRPVAASFAVNVDVLPEDRNFEGRMPNGVGSAQSQVCAVM
jgi:hypothetical protein